MKKRTSHYKLPDVKALIKQGKVRSTVSALTGGAALGLDFNGIIDVVMKLTSKDFHKSMTAYADHKFCKTYIVHPHQ